MNLPASVLVDTGSPSIAPARGGEYVERILSARVYDVAVESPLEKARMLSERLGSEVYLKREDCQQVFSFKCRGAFNAIYQRTREGRLEGVVAASAGNHGQGVALAATKLGLRSVVVMPRTTPEIKVQAVRRLGASVVLHGDGYDAAYEHARETEKKEGLTFIHAFDDPHTSPARAPSRWRSAGSIPIPSTRSSCRWEEVD